MNDPLNRDQLLAGLLNLGVASGMIVEVHGSLSKFGRVQGGAGTVVDVLMEIVGPKGAIVMSAYPLLKLPLTAEDTALGITYKSRSIVEGSLEDKNAQSTMGAIADEFRKRPGVQLGVGGHRLAAWGRNAHLHVMGLEYLLANAGRALLLGVGIHRLSSMHVPDSVVGFPKDIQMLWRPVPDEIRTIYPADQFYIECGHSNGPPRDGWQPVWDEAVSKGLVRTDTIGNAPCHLFKTEDVVGRYERHLRDDPWTLFGVSKQ